MLSSVVPITTKRAPGGAVAAVVVPLSVGDDADMSESPYPYGIIDPPGATVRRLRQALDMSQRRLAERCHPELDHSTIYRLERNLGYTQDTLERVAVALGISVQDLFLPPELAAYATLPEAVRDRIAATVADAAAAYRARKS